MSFTSRALRDALGMFPTGVTVVTTRSGNGELHGVTVNSFNSVSLDPPLVLFSLARNLNSLSAYLSAEAYAINILREDQRHLSEQFASPHAAKWDNVDHRVGATGSPVLHPALAVLECRPHAHHDGGDHIILVGRVVHLDKSTHRHPLLFFRGRYHGVNEAWLDGEEAPELSGDGENL